MANSNQHTEPPDSSPNNSPSPGKRGIKQRSVIAIATFASLAVAWFLVNRYWEQQEKDFRKCCQQASSKRDWEQLYTKAVEWNNWDPKAAEPRLHLADAFVNQDKIEQAVKVLESIPPDFEGYAQVLSVRADLLFSELHQPFAAEEVWKTLLQIEPRASVAIQRLIYLYAVTIQRAKMQALIMYAIEERVETPECYSYLILANDLKFSDGLALTTRWRNFDRNNEVLEVAQAIYAATTSANREVPKFGTDAVMPGDESLFKACLLKFPNNLELLALAADQAIFSGKTETVKDIMKRAPDAAKDDNRFWRYRGWLLQTQGKLPQAEAALRKSLELHPFGWRSRLLLADVLRKRNLTQQADLESKRAHEGKELTSRILTSPNARQLEIELVEDMLSYTKEVGPEPIARAFAARLE